jgi:tetratricopeptide (TPR) repeat protein
LNKLFAESLYEVGWLQKPVGEARPSLPLMTAAERSEKTKAFARSKFEQSQQALRQRDLAAALKLVDDADKADPNQPATLNLRGEILMQEQKFEDAEAAFKKSAKLDPKLREAQYNLAQVPFKKKDYAKARERFEGLYKRTPGGDKNQAAELIKFKIYMTLLLEGKESRAHAMMEEFQFTGDTPALYYAQAAWEYKHNNPEKAADWTGSANKIYSPALNSVFADAFYDVGWMQRPEGTTAALAFDTTSAGAPQAEGGPAVEPSPIPDRVFAANKQADSSKAGALSLAPTAPGQNAGMEIGSPGATADQSATSVSTEPAAATSPQPEQVATESSPSAGEPTTAAQSVPAETPNASSASSEQNNQQPTVQTSPPEKPAVSSAPLKALSSVTGASSRRLWVVGGLLLAAIAILAWVIVPVVRRHAFNVPRHLRLDAPSPAATTDAAALKPRLAPVQSISVQGKASGVQGNGFVGGPRQISVELKPWTPSLRHSVVPARKLSSAFDRLKERKAKLSRTPAPREPDRDLTPLTEPNFESAVGPVLEQTPEILQSAPSQTTEVVGASARSESLEVPTIAPQAPNQIPDLADEIKFSMPEAYESPAESKEAALIPEESSETFWDTEPAWPAVEASTEVPVESIGQEQLEEIVLSANESPAAEATIEPISDFTSAPSSEPVFPQTTTPATMPETTQTPIAPVNKAPAPAAPVAKPQPSAAAMQTSVQLTFSFEIAAMQLTPSFKMGVLKVRPISKLVTMRLPSPQRAQSALNLQVAFEVVKIQPVAGALGTLRVVPSQQQRPTMAGMPSFAVAGFQVVPNSETAPVQLTPSQQGRASVFITVPFQISTLEFSPSLEIASVILNSNSKQVVVQLPGGGPGPAEGAPMFEIANLELGENGDIAMMQLNLLGGPKRA